MTIKEGGQLQHFIGEKLTAITIRTTIAETNRMAELWINDDSVSYLTIDELLDLKKEIVKALQSIIEK